MQALEFIDTDIPFLKGTDTVGFSLDLMSGCAMTELPVISDRRYAGMMSEDILLNQPDMDLAVGKLPLEFSEISIPENEHVFELIRRMVKANHFIMPVIDTEGLYVGTANSKSIVNRLGSSTSIMEPGGLLVLQMNKRDYSLIEIARIVESNDGQILNSFISGQRDLSAIQVTLKINKIDLEDIIQSFERFGYTVSEAYHQSGREEDLQERFDSLMHYLNM